MVSNLSLEILDWARGWMVQIDYQGGGFDILIMMNLWNTFSSCMTNVLTGYRKVVTTVKNNFVADEQQIAVDCRLQWWNYCDKVSDWHMLPLCWRYYTITASPAYLAWYGRLMRSVLYNVTSYNSLHTPPSYTPHSSLGSPKPHFIEVLDWRVWSGESGVSYHYLSYRVHHNTGPWTILISLIIPTCWTLHIIATSSSTEILDLKLPLSVTGKILTKVSKDHSWLRRS